MEKFSWLNAVESANQIGFIFVDRFTGVSVVILEEESKNAFSDEFGFDEIDREKLQDIKFGESIVFTDWTVFKALVSK